LFINLSIFNIPIFDKIYRLMKIITSPSSLSELWDSREIDFTEMMKIVVDIGRGILAIDADMHADLEQLLLEHGSLQKDLWGANIYPLKDHSERLEFTSFINIRPSLGNRSMEITDIKVKKELEITVKRLLI
jgi:hypothetical protein